MTITERRLALGLSQRQLAAESGVGRQTIAKAETNSGTLAPHTLSRITATLDRLEAPESAEDPEWTQVAADDANVVLRGPDGRLWVAYPLNNTHADDVARAREKATHD